jgi:hypothetical protein
MCPSTAGGGYVAAFIEDPLDEDTSFDAIQGTHGAVMAKWWEHSMINVAKPAKDLLWTSLGENARLYSPGKLVLTAVGSNDATVNVSVLCKWEVELSVPSLEEADAPITEYITTQSLFTNQLEHLDNIIHIKDLFDGQFTPNMVLQTNVPFAIDYRLGSGDVTKADYNCLYVNPSATTFTYGTTDATDKFHAGVGFYEDGQPLQVVIAKGTKFDVIINPNL